jgi:hypothetical protein
LLYLRREVLQGTEAKSLAQPACPRLEAGVRSDIIKRIRPTEALLSTYTTLLVPFLLDSVIVTVIINQKPACTVLEAEVVTIWKHLLLGKIQVPFSMVLAD